jgi:L-ascorbate metabolism protein UlaG (beta-lactamase superfamily)
MKGALMKSLKRLSIIVLMTLTIVAAAQSASEKPPVTDILTLGDKRLYIAGDTENTPEMKALKDIDIAFLPMNLPYTMTPEQVADAALAFKPSILYPYHYGTTDPQQLVDLLKTHPEIEVRILALK